MNQVPAWGCSEKQFLSEQVQQEITPTVLLIPHRFPDFSLFYLVSPCEGKAQEKMVKGIKL